MLKEQCKKPLSRKPRRVYEPPRVVRVRLDTTGSLVTEGKQYATTYCTTHYHDDAGDCIIGT
jgi:hypothetical protein